MDSFVPISSKIINRQHLEKNPFQVFLIKEKDLINQLNSKYELKISQIGKQKKRCLAFPAKQE